MVRSALLRPKRARLASASLADCARSPRFLKRRKLTSSPIIIPHAKELRRRKFGKKAVAALHQNAHWPAQYSFQKVLSKRPVIVSESMFRCAKAKYWCSITVGRDLSQALLVFRRDDL